MTAGTVVRGGVVGVITALAVVSSGAQGAPVQKAPFGKTADGKPVEVYTLTNKNGLEARIMTYGATLVSLKVPDRAGHLGNVVLGFDSVAPYVAGVPFYGATIGRFANRIANARFTLDGKTYDITKNDGPNSLHGGKGFDKRVWTAQTFENKQGPGIKLTYVSADGEEGYPGQLTIHVSYQLRDDNDLSIVYDAVTTKPTPVNFTNHTYFNLSGDPQNTILDEKLTINADRFTPVNATLIPTGELRAVAGTPFDFRKPTVIGTHINDNDEQVRFAHGFDDNWILNQSHAGAMTLASVLTDPSSGRELEVRTTEPGIQFYTGNFMDGKPAGTGTVFKYRTGLTLETQHYPDSPNQAKFPNTILRPGKAFHSRTDFIFRVVK
jgi:aldose 1-epimerase